MSDYRVILESGWVVRDVDTLDDAIGIAISEAGKRLNPKAKFVEIEIGQAICPFCEQELNNALIVSNIALVGLSLEMKVFKAESEAHAERIAKSVIGKSLRDIPLKVLEVEEISGSN